MKDFNGVDGRNLMSQAKFYESYSRWNDELGRYETWEEAVDRVMDMHKQKYSDKLSPELISLMQEATDSYKKKEVLGAQRALQFGGDQLLKHEMKLYNCLASYCDRPSFFGEYLYSLLCGSGFGFSVQKRHLSKLPKILERKKAAKIHVVEDSIEGWATALDVLLSSYFEGGGVHPEYEGRRVYFDLSKIRPKGSLISGGFKAPGPEPLRRALDKIEHLLQEQLLTLSLDRLRSIVAYDICMHAADAVIAGGVRRAATICWFDVDDEDMLSAKTGDWFIKNPQRGRSNNSAVILRNETSKEEFDKVFKYTKEFGEPGFLFMDHPDHAFNPCVEIGLFPQFEGETGIQGCVAYDTKLITKDGIALIGELADNQRSVEIWNGKRWSAVTPVKTNENVRLYRVHFGDGSYLDATDYHKFLVKNRFQKEYMEVTTKELIELLKTSKYTIHVPRVDMVMEGGVSSPFAYDYGFVLGDGTVPKTRTGNINKPFAEVYEHEFKHDFPFVEAHKGSVCERYGTSFYRVYFDGVDKEFAYSMKYDFGLPSELFSWDRDSLKGFFKGWMDSDGTKTKNGFRIYGREDKIRDGQLLLTKMGINSSVNLMAKAGMTANEGRLRKNDVWYLQVSNPMDLDATKFDLTENKGMIAKSKFQTVRSVEKLDGLYDSYCFEEFELHQGVFNNVLTKQCNLTEINGSSISDENDFYHRCKVASILGTLQAGYTNFKFVGEVTKKIFEREALLGCSVTGWMNSPDILLNEEVLKKGAEIVKETNKKVAELIGINPSARTTCVKPAGNASVLLETASGVHPEHSPMYFRYMQMNKETEVAKLIKEQNPYMIEDSVWSQSKTDYAISFPIVSPETSMYKDELYGIDFLEKIKMIQGSWVEHGTNLDNCVDKRLRHNVSNTVQVPDGKWDEVRDYLYENRNHFAGVSFIPQTGDRDFNQAPNTEVKTAEEIVNEYGNASLFASGLIVDATHGFNNLWEACMVSQMDSDHGEKEKVDQRAEWIRRFRKFAENYFGGDMKRAEYCLKDVHILHKWNKVTQNMKGIDFVSELCEKSYTDIDTMGATACAAGGCEI